MPIESAGGGYILRTSPLDRRDNSALGRSFIERAHLEGHLTTPAATPSLMAIEKEESAALCFEEECANECARYAVDQAELCLEEERAKPRLEEECAKPRIEEERAKPRFEEEPAKSRLEEERPKSRLEEERATSRQKRANVIDPLKGMRKGPYLHQNAGDFRKYASQFTAAYDEMVSTCDPDDSSIHLC